MRRNNKKKKIVNEAYYLYSFFFKKKEKLFIIHGWMTNESQQNTHSNIMNLPKHFNSHIIHNKSYKAHTAMKFVFN